MLTIVGNGMGEYDFSNIYLDLEQFDIIICDKNFKEVGKKILKFNYKDAKKYIIENFENKNIVYVVTGSPFVFSAGILIAKQLPKDKVKIIDNVSSKSYIQQKLLIGDNEIEILSLHGRSAIDLTKFLNSYYTLVLCYIFTIERIKKACNI